MADNTVSQDVLDLVDEYSKRFFEPRAIPKGLWDEVSVGERLSKTGKTEYWEKKRRARKTTVASAYTAGDGVVVVTTIDPFFENAIISLGTALFRVSAINSTTNTLTIVEVSGTDADVASGQTITVKTNAAVEGSTANASSRNDEFEVNNTTQIMYDVIEMSQSVFESDQKVGGREFVKQVADKMADFKKNASENLWSETINIPTTKGDLGFMAGIPYYISANGYTGSSLALTGANLSEFLRYMYDEQGGAPTELWMNPVDLMTISNFDSGYFQRDAGSGERGIVARSFTSTTGIEVMLKTDPTITSGSLYAFNSADVVWKPFRDLQVNPLAKTGDNVKFEVVTEMSLEVNPSNQMGVFVVA